MMSRQAYKTALRSARRLLVAERRQQYECFTMAPHRNDAETYKQMNRGERAAIRRFDGVIAKIDAVLK